MARVAQYGQRRFSIGAKRFQSPHSALDAVEQQFSQDPRGKIDPAKHTIPLVYR